jgi:hypothetical protein
MTLHQVRSKIPLILFYNGASIKCTAYSFNYLQCSIYSMEIMICTVFFKAEKHQTPKPIKSCFVSKNFWGCIACMSHTA